jgi:hypothetical protein
MNRMLIRWTLMLFAAASFIAASASAQAGGYTVQTPGQLPTYVSPNVGGGYTVQTPGALRSYQCWGRIYNSDTGTTANLC